VGGYTNFKLGWNYRREEGSRNMTDIQHKNAKIYRKRRKIAEILQSNRKSGSMNRTAVSTFTPEVHK